MAAMAAKQARVDFRATPEIKSLIEQAATLYGMTVSEFIKATVVEKSREVVERAERRVLSDRDRDVFLAVLSAPAAPKTALVNAAEKFRTAVQEGELVP
jgi:uncharacterized protein (DUF1778 family)